MTESFVSNFVESAARTNAIRYARAGGGAAAAAAAWGAARKSLLEGEETYIENTRASAFHEFDPCFLLR